jgi:hypothetical protein
VSNHENILASFRRPYASIVLSSALGWSLIRGVETGDWIPWELAAVVSGVILGDGVNRTVEKIRSLTGQPGRGESDQEVREPAAESLPGA